MTTIINHTEYTAAVNEAKLHDYRYFTLNAPTISDEEYDRLYFAIQDYETAHPDEVLADSPTQCSHGEAVNGHMQVARRLPMLSIDKLHSVDALRRWMDKMDEDAVYDVEWKYDGVSVSLVYLGGVLVEASYGKGATGNDCHRTCLSVDSIPNHIHEAERMEVRGEMVVPFARLARSGYKNCRSAAAGILADTNSLVIDCLEFHPYCAILGDGNYLRLAELHKYGFIADMCKCAMARNIDECIAQLTNERRTLDFPTDGLVIKLHDQSRWGSFGRTAKAWKYQVAYKFMAETAVTTIKDIRVNMGRTGKRTPVAYFDPVKFNGCTYQKASLGSERIMDEMGIQVGSMVVVSLRNDVIPHVDGLADEDGCVMVRENNQQSPTQLTENEEASVIAREEIHNSPTSLTGNRQERESTASQAPSFGRVLFAAIGAAAIIGFGLVIGLGAFFLTPGILMMKSKM